MLQNAQLFVVNNSYPVRQTNTDARFCPDDGQVVGQCGYLATNAYAAGTTNVTIVNNLVGRGLLHDN